jgi:chloride channel 7
MMATLALNLSKSAGKWLLGYGNFGWFDQEVAFEVFVSFSSHILAVVPALVIGLLAGLFAVLFTLLNIKVSRLRHELSSHLKWVPGGGGVEEAEKRQDKGGL